MFLLPMEEIKVLMEKRSGFCVSLFMPTHRLGEETRQDPIRFQNLLRNAEEELINKGVRAVDAQSLLEPAHSLEGYSPFWRHLNDGLAMYISRDNFRYYTLPLPFEEQVVISEHFYIKPLLPMLSGDGRFYILALSQNQVRLLQGTRYSVGEIEVADIPESLEMLIGEKERIRQIQFHTRSSGGQGKRPAIFFGHGEKEDQSKQEILSFFREVEEQVSQLLLNDKAPLILAGVDYLLPIYKNANSYPHLLGEGLKGNPDQLSAKQLHEQAWKIVGPLFKREQEDLKKRYHSLANTDRISTRLEDILPAAVHGRIEHVFVSLGTQCWGSYDPDTNQLVFHHQAQPGSEELLQYVCNHVIVNGGSVLALDKNQMAVNSLLAAIFRY